MTPIILILIPNFKADTILLLEFGITKYFSVCILLAFKDNSDPAEFIKNALSPAKDAIVTITDPMKKEALAIVNDDNLSLAIGKKGTNIKLASKLTKYKIEVKTLNQVNEEGNN